MNINLIKGSFTAGEATELITQLIQVKIKFHENKISKTHNEEDIKMREKRIKQLQEDLYNARKHIGKRQNTIAIESEIFLSE
ncbi:MAG: hypothetical protein JST75_09000 [Bacteroidetes bacterium]|nr:hypothetical protein [Bacteroidota bacterium]